VIVAAGQERQQQRYEKQRDSVGLIHRRLSRKSLIGRQRPVRAAGIQHKIAYQIPSPGKASSRHQGGSAHSVTAPSVSGGRPPKMAGGIELVAGFPT
jgi:hypothetical protein